METQGPPDDHQGYATEDIAMVLAALTFIYGLNLFWSASTFTGTDLDIFLGVLAFISAAGLLVVSWWGLLSSLAFFAGLLVKHSASIADQPTDGDLPIVVLSLIMILVLIGLRKEFLSAQ